MKKLLFAIAFVAAGSVAALAQDTASVATQTPPSTEYSQDQDGVRRPQSGDAAKRARRGLKLLPAANFQHQFSLHCRVRITADGL